MRLDIIPERPCLPVGEVTSLPMLLRPLPTANCRLPAASIEFLEPGESGGWRRNGLGRLNRLDPCEFLNRVILLTDGQANDGIIDPAILVKHSAELTEDGITTTTIGYGEDFNEDLVTATSRYPPRGTVRSRLVRSSLSARSSRLDRHAEPHGLFQSRVDPQKNQAARVVHWEEEVRRSASVGRGAPRPSIQAVGVSEAGALPGGGRPQRRCRR